MKERVQYIDVAKFLGIFAIYLGHFGTLAGATYPFVFKYHVELFFFLSGCTNFYDNEPNFSHYIWKRFKTIMLPFWIFSMITVVYKALDNSVNGLSEVCSMLLTILRGNIRTTFIASSLWFLTCLFVMELVFKLLKYLRNPMLILCIAVGMHYIAAYIMSPSPVVKPHLLYNIDSMLYYIIFYAIGFLSYPYINKLFQLNSKPKLICYGITGCISALYSILVFSGHAPTFGSFNHLICSLTIIWFNLILAKMFEKVSLFVSVGRETLYLCGNEFIIRSIVPTCLNMIGLSQNIYSPIEAYLLTILYFAIELKILIPFEKQLVKSICQLKISDNK